MDGEVKRKQVSSEQLTALLDFLKGHVDLAKGLSRGRRRRGKFHAIKTWNLCAKKLNAYKNGAVKDGKAWSKYWCDWKYRVRRRALELQVSREGNRPLPEGMVPLSPMEETIMNIIGESMVDGVMIVNDPLAEASLDEDIPNYTDNNRYIEQASTSGVKRRHGMDVDETVPVDRKPSIDSTSGDYECTGGIKTRSSKRLKTRKSSNNSVSETESITQPETKPEVTHIMEADTDKTTMFLNLERQKIYENGKIVRSLEMIHGEITKLASVMSEIKDCLNKHYRRISVN
ncbi:unnamed protein product [Chrysodeixis includens]|uniref:Regulatory protein zeste n=1 Tax=Chrysodeixis includens TaxID=689277 RepID=A0A9P0BZW2_CHRIL|nr:unnamed protein product [Chrysodeixis includens]